MPRHAGEAVYTLLNIERGVPEVFGSTYDIRALLSAASYLRDGAELRLPGPGFVNQWLLGKLDETEIGELLTEFGLVPEKPRVP
jgi:oleate hydratase